MDAMNSWLGSTLHLPNPFSAARKKIPPLEVVSLAMMTHDDLGFLADLEELPWELTCVWLGSHDGCLVKGRRHYFCLVMTS
jgi:hypothetical protein